MLAFQIVWMILGSFRYWHQTRGSASHVHNHEARTWKMQHCHCYAVFWSCCSDSSRSLNTHPCRSQNEQQRADVDQIFLEKRSHEEEIGRQEAQQRFMNAGWRVEGMKGWRFGHFLRKFILTLGAEIGVNFGHFFPSEAWKLKSEELPGRQRSGSMNSIRINARSRNGSL